MINILVFMAYSSQWFLLFPSTWVFKSQKFPHSLNLTSCSVIFGIYDIPSDLTMMIATIKSWRRQLITALNFFLSVEILRWFFNCRFPLKFIFFPCNIRDHLDILFSVLGTSLIYLTKNMSYLTKNMSASEKPLAEEDCQQ